MHTFLSNNRDELIARCKVKVAMRSRRAATDLQLADGVPLFLDQLTRTLAAEGEGNVAESLRLSGAAGGDAASLSVMGMGAAAHGKKLLELGFTLDQVVHDYGDLCQAITDLAVERDAPFAVNEFRTLNRCLDNAIADAVTAFSFHRDETVSTQRSAEENERLGVMVHELRNHLHTASMAFSALESGQVSVAGSTGAVLKRSLMALTGLLARAVSGVRLAAGTPARAEVFSLAALVADARHVASLYAHASGCALAVPEVDPLLGVAGDRELLLAALVNLLQNAFKFTRPHTEVALTAHAVGDRVFIEVSDHCGGLPPQAVALMFRPFAQLGSNRVGLGLGLSIAKRSIDASGGLLTVRDVRGTGCVFTIELARMSLQ